MQFHRSSYAGSLTGWIAWSLVSAAFLLTLVGLLIRL
jgi:hypothetical protein